MTVVVFSLYLTPSGMAFNLDSLLLLSVGGEEGLRTIRAMSSFRATGEIVLNGQRGTFLEIVAPPNKIYYSLTFPDFNITQGYDGQDGWQSDLNGRISRISGFEMEALIQSLYLETYSYLLPNRIPGRIAYAKDTVVEGQPYHMVEFYPLNADTIRVLFEQGSGMRRLQYARMDNVSTVVSYDDIQMVDHVPIARLQRSTAFGVPLAMEMMLDSAEFNAPYDPTIFSPPGAEKITFPGDADSIEIPFEFSNGHIYLIATINGKKKVRLILDSGASATVFNSGVIADLDLQIVGSMPARGVAGYAETKLVQTDSVSIGAITLYKQIGGTVDLSSLRLATGDSLPFGGLIGYDFLSRYPMMVDYERSVLVVFNPEKFTPPMVGHAIPFDLTMQVPTVEVSVDGATGRFLIDLGNAMGLILHEQFTQQNRFDTLTSLQSDEHRKIGGIGGGVAGKWVILPDFRVGTLILENVPAILSAGSHGITGSYAIDGNIGNELLRTYKVVFDYQRQMLYLLPAHD